MMGGSIQRALHRRPLGSKLKVEQRGVSTAGIFVVWGLGRRGGMVGVKVVERRPSWCGKESRQRVASGFYLRLVCSFVIS